MSQPSIRPTLYKGYRFPPEIISRCVWLYYRFGVSLREVSELMRARGIEVSHEAIRLWTLRFGTEYARRLRRTRGRVLEHLAVPGELQAFLGFRDLVDGGTGRPGRACHQPLLATVARLAGPP